MVVDRGNLGSRSPVGREVAVRSLSLRSKRELLHCMQRIGFGSIRELHVRGGQPIFDPQPVILREIKLGGENGPRPQLGAADYVLKRGRSSSCSPTSTNCRTVSSMYWRSSMDCHSAW